MLDNLTIMNAARSFLQSQLDTLESQIQEETKRTRGKAIIDLPEIAHDIRETRPGRKKFTASQRKRMSEAQKARWAAKKNGGEQPAPAAGKPARRKMSAAGRERIVAATKARWAAFHKAKEAAARKPAGKSKSAGGK